MFVEMLLYLKILGVNVIEFMFCYEFNELEYYSVNLVMGEF